ncbi:MAG: SGNH/GDSL hydrolase family protein [Candidatus Marinimicrobia bacterium]|nr:SGNH/GDSL hydrolase family protein [Candidatus Neomarinimicrobiota bacterium]
MLTAMSLREFAAIKSLGKISAQNLALMGFSLIITLTVAEVALRLIGWMPGQVKYSQWFHPVNSLHLVDGFTTDTNGIFKVDTSIAHIVGKICKSSPDILNSSTFNSVEQNIIPEVWLVYNNTNTGKNEFQNRIRGIKTGQLKDCFDSTLIHYQNNPINDDGFYSIPFSTHCGNRTKVLLLGDSFTWGHSSLDKTGSFSNILLARDYIVYNTGVSGADVAQYKRILETYFEQIDPDVVVVNFYMGNDVEYFHRIPQQDSPILYNTNAGNLYSFQYGVQYSTMESTYAMVVHHMNIPEVTVLNRMAASTAMGTIVWNYLVQIGVYDPQFENVLDRPEIPYCNNELEWMLEFCNRNKTQFILSVIPNLNKGNLDGASTIPHLFDGIPYNAPDMSPELYKQDDLHFNEKGHLFYANYLEKLIEEKYPNDRAK